MKHSGWLGLVAVLGLHAVLPAAEPASLPPATPVTWEPGPGDGHFPDANDGAASRGRLFGGGGLYVIQPYFSSNQAYAIYQETKSGDLDSASFRRVDISHHMDAAPLAWLGYIGPGGLGFRVSWWSFAQGSNQTVLLPQSTGSTDTTLVSAGPLGAQLFANTNNGSAEFNTTSSLNMQVGDVEIFQTFCGCKWDVLLGGGIRIAHLNQDYSAFVNEVVEAGPVQSILTSGHNFTGAGPLLTAEVHRGLAGGLGLYGTARAALLFGGARQLVFETGSPGDPSPITGSEHRDRVLPVGEMELGVECGRCVGPAWLFAQVGLVGQDWIGAGNASRTARVAVPTAFPLYNASVDSDLGLFGLAIRLGFNY